MATDVEQAFLRELKDLLAKWQPTEEAAYVGIQALSRYRNTLVLQHRQGKTVKADPYLEKLDELAASIPDIRRMDYSKYLCTDYWRAVRELKFKESGRKCHKCRATEGLVIHHLSYDNRGREHRNLDDLRVLCEDCHAKAHKHKNPHRNRRSPKKVVGGEWWGMTAGRR